MADSKISQLTPITGANLLDSDEFIVARADTFENFAVTRAELFLDTPDITTSDLTATTVDINGGTIDGTVIGGSTAAAGSFTTLDATGGGSLTGTWSDLGTVTTVDINGGTIDGTVVGGSTPAAISGTTGTFSGDLTVDTNTLFVDASTNQVGIGTSSPTGLLTLGSGAPRLDFLESNGSAGFDNTTLIRDGDVFSFQTRNGSTFVSNDYRITTNASGALTHEWRIGNSEAMRIDASGNVGIGTSSPSEKLHVDGNIAVSGIVDILSGTVELNGNTLSGIQVTIADDAVAELTFPRRLFGVLNTVEGPDNDAFPDQNLTFIGFVDFGNSPDFDVALQLTDVEVNTTDVLSGTTGTDGKLTIGLGGTSGTLYLENRRGGARTMNVTLL